MKAALAANRAALPRDPRTSTAASQLAQVGSWRLTQLVSAGRFCRVYRAAPADHATRDAAYALKLLSPEAEQMPEAVACLCREAQVGREASHANLIPVLAAHTSMAPYYIVMPWLDGSTLAATLKSGPLPTATAFWIARQIAEALDSLHQAGWLHGDIKADNIHLSPQRHATLLDLGFAQRMPAPTCAFDGYLLGTLTHMAPERFNARLNSDIRSDLYSLGVTLYQMLTGRRLFTGHNAAEIIRQHRSARPEDLRRALPQLPREAAELVARMLAKEPLRRPQTPRELVDQLVRLEISLLAER
jgi:serine/threonine-protein kinase